jgi:citrate synthase
VGSIDRVSECVIQELAIHGKLPGFGHRIYSGDDPRATHMKRIFKELAKSHGQWYLIAEATVRCMEERSGMHPNIDFYAAPVLYHLGFPLELFTNVIASARVAGWAAHVLEQYGEMRIMRPRADYIGPRIGQ